ncbi:MAG: Rrf2 family transcriptional regulator [Planctomycetes bacterium]|nr:Rrf2 family transcriptional regulator [Planctomycetota bacterium]
MLCQTVGYAITALGHLAANDHPMLVREIAAGTGIPTAYLAKLINMLSRKGFVATQRGIGGGVSMARKPEQVTLHELCAALDDPLLMPRCLLGNDECSDLRACPAHRFWVVHREKEIDYLKKTTLRHLAEFETKRVKTAHAPPRKRR